MDTDNVIPAFGNGVGHENGDVSEKVEGVQNGIISPNGNTNMVSKSEDSGTFNSSIEDVTEGLAADADSNGFTVSKEIEVKETENSKPSKPSKGHGKARNEKPLSPKPRVPALVKKGRDGKVLATSSVSNGSVEANSRPKQPVTMGTKSRLPFNADVPKLSGKSDAPSSTVNATDSESLVEKTKLKPLRKGPPNKAEESTEASLSPISTDAKSRKVGILPAYDFSFKCDERAEKRREFYTKLEEKIHAKEVEKSTIQAKSKESQEAEIKMLRKSLTFKATPMPTFYQEPPPPKAELKKIPTTRAKSPKLGRKKSSPTRDSGANNGLSVRSARLSLDEKVSLNNPTKGPAPVQVKKPLRKSLPRLPSQKNRLSSDQTKSASHETTRSDDTKVALSNETNQAAEEAAIAVPSQTQPNPDSVVPVVEDLAEKIAVPEPIPVEH